MTTSPLTANPRLLANITQQADSRHNVEMQQLDQQQQQQGGKPAPAQAQAQKDLGYFQRQYHTAVMSDSIRAHQDYLRTGNTPNTATTQPPQQQHHQAPRAGNVQEESAQRNAGPARGGSRRGSPVQPSTRSAAVRPAFPATTATTGAPHPDVDGYPCPCPDCNIARLQEAMDEAQAEAEAVAMMHHNNHPPMMHQQHQPPFLQHGAHYGYPPQHQQHAHPQQQMSPTMPPNPNAAPFGAVPQPYDFYGNPLPLVRPTATQPRATRQHSPYKTYVSVTVGYSPDSGYYQSPTPIPSAGPSSPLQQDSAYAQGGHDSAFDVPYIPATQDFSRFAHMDDDVNRTLDMEEVTPQRQRSSRRGGRNLSPVEEKVNQTPVSLRRQPPQPQTPPTPGQDEATPLRGSKGARGTTTAGGRRTSPLAKDASATSSPDVAAAKEVAPINKPSAKSRSPNAGPRPVCPYVLKVRTSKYHVRTVVSPFAFDDESYISLEGDRGRDVGKVLSCSRAQFDGDTRQLPMALQHATAQEIEAIAQNEADAEASVAPAMIAARRLRLPMQIVGAVYQHDRAKLTFMYEATERVDFRQLLRDLYSDYRCRIWMEVPAGSANPLARSPSPTQQTA